MNYEKDGGLHFLEVSVRHEEAMAQLYDVLQHQVPESKALWSVLYREELGHANRIERLMREVKAGTSYLDEAAHNPDVVKKSLNTLLPRINSWGRKGVTKKDAFEYAMLMEGSMIEYRFFIPSPDDSAFTKEILAEMQKGTNSHLERVKAEYQKHGLSSDFLQNFAAKLKSFLSIG